MNQIGKNGGGPKGGEDSEGAQPKGVTTESAVCEATDLGVRCRCYCAASCSCSMLQLPLLLLLLLLSSSSSAAVRRWSDIEIPRCIRPVVTLLPPAPHKNGSTDTQEPPMHLGLA